MKITLKLVISLSLIISILSFAACTSNPEATNEKTASQDDNSLIIKHQLGETTIEKSLRGL